MDGGGGELKQQQIAFKQRKRGTSLGKKEAEEEAWRAQKALKNSAEQQAPSISASAVEAVKPAPALTQCTTQGKAAPSFVAPPAVAIAAAEEETEEMEGVLRGFDMDMRYGPCIGLSRLQRWTRAMKLGLCPPREIKDLLEGPLCRPVSLWEGRV